MKINKKIIKELSDYLEEFNLTELEYTEKDTKIKVSKNNISINNQNTPIPKTELNSANTNRMMKFKFKDLLNISINGLNFSCKYDFSYFSCLHITTLIKLFNKS